MSNRTSHAERIGEPGAIIRVGGNGLEMVNLRWGLEPAEPDGRPFEVVRAESRTFPTRRCLVPASEFFVTRKGKRYHVTLSNHDWFYFAGIWRPATPQWPSAYAVLTIEANEDVRCYSERQMAVLPRAERMDWLDLTRPESDVLRALPAHTFQVELYDEQDDSRPQLAL